MKQADNCIFCKIAQGQASAIKVFENEHCLAFMDLYPANPGHTLVICKAHYSDIHTLPADTLTATMHVVQRIAHALKQALSPDGIRINQFNGAAAGQTVFHYHVHLVPMQTGQIKRSHGRHPGDPAELAAIAERIRQALGE